MRIMRYMAAAAVALLAACGPRESADIHDHHDHDHETEHEHDHDHEGHDHEHEHDGHDHEHEEEGHAHGADEIILSPEQAASAGVTTDTARAADFRGVIATSGRILPATGDETVVVAKVAGVVRLSRPWTDGTPVAAGAAVATVSTAGLAEGDVGERARIDFTRARSEYERSQKLLADGLTTQREFEAARAEYERARLAYEAVGAHKGGAHAATAPKGGFVKALMVADGDFVSVGQPIMTITGNRRLYLRADLPERYYAQAPSISSARFTAAYDGSRVFSLDSLGGRLVSFGRGSGSGSATVPVTFEFDNAQGVVPDSYAEVYLLTAPRAGVVTVPLGAVTEEQGVNYIYLRLDPTCYQRRVVTLGQSDGERVEITSGLAPGEEYVSRGAIHVKLASAKTIPGHTHNH